MAVTIDLKYNNVNLDAIVPFVKENLVTYCITESSVWQAEDVVGRAGQAEDD